MMKLIHLALYAKGHYKRTDIWEDLKQCLRAHDYEPDTHSDVLGIIQARVTEYVLKQYSDAATAMREFLSDIDPQNTWKVGYYHKDGPIIGGGMRMIEEMDKPYDYKEAVLRVYLSRLVSMTREELGWTDDMNIVADPNVLPLREQRIDDEDYHHEVTHKQ